MPLFHYYVYSTTHIAWALDAVEDKCAKSESEGEKEAKSQGPCYVCTSIGTSIN